MKPDSWNDLSTARKMRIAHELLNSMRGQYIVGQALAKAVAVMRQAEYPETSNIEDMELLGETLFSLGYAIEKAKVP